MALEQLWLKTGPGAKSRYVAIHDIVDRFGVTISGYPRSNVKTRLEQSNYF